MKRLYITVYIFLFSFLLTVTIYSSDRSTRNYDFKDFNRVEVSNGILLNITHSSSYSIEVSAEDADFNFLKVDKKGNTLQIYIDSDNYKKIGDIKINIKMPLLTGLDLSGGTMGDITMSMNDNFNCNLSGGSRVFGKLNCGNLNMEISGGSIVDFEGKGEIFTADASGGSIYHLKDFNVKDVNAGLSGGSKLEIIMDGTLNVDASGGSRVVYYGSANIGSTDFSGGSGISQGK